MKKQNQQIIDLIEHFGSQVKTAEALKVKQPTVSAWLHNTHGVSAGVALRLQRITYGRFLAVDYCAQLKEGYHA
jgi:transcriptional repressor of cell division inhibition gene dicB